MKKNYKDMLLESGSGFMMPFPLRDDEDCRPRWDLGCSNIQLVDRNLSTMVWIF